MAETEASPDIAAPAGEPVLLDKAEAAGEYREAGDAGASAETTMAFGEAEAPRSAVAADEVAPAAPAEALPLPTASPHLIEADVAASDDVEREESAPAITQQSTAAQGRRSR